MKLGMKLALPTLAALLLAGCVARHPVAEHFLGKAHFLVDPACLTRPLLLEDCDAASSPLHCRAIYFGYRKGCERLEVKRHF